MIFIINGSFMDESQSNFVDIFEPDDKNMVGSW